MEYNRLFEFVVLSKELNYKKAAKKLGISADTLSKRLLSLEKSANCALLDHTSKKVQLTASGELFLQDAKKIVSDFEHTLQRLRTVQEHSSENLTIAISGIGMPPGIGIAINNICSTFPNLQLSILDDSIYAIEEGLQNQNVDIYFCYLENPGNNPELRYRQLFTTQLCVVIPHNHKNAAKTTIDFKDFNGEVFFPYPALADSSLHDYEVKILKTANPSIQISDIGHSKTFFPYCVSSGLGNCLFPWVLRNHIPPDTVEIPLPGEYVMHMYMVYARENTSPIVHSFIREVLRQRI